MTFFSLTSAVLVLFACSGTQPEANNSGGESCKNSVNQLKINQLQMLGSHNSYRQQLPKDIAVLLANPPMPLPEGFQPSEWDYGHLPLEEQFDNYGIRSIELDVFNDPEGGLFYQRKGNGFVGGSPDSEEEKLKEPGLKILHFPDFDYQSHYLTFVDALKTVKQWSEAHPNHLPITVMVEPKEDNPSDLLPGMGLTQTIPFDRKALENIDQEIKSVFGENLETVITPDEVRGNYPTLNEAILKNGFPALADTRGKVLFVMLPSKNELSEYLAGHPSLKGRTMFAFSKPGNPEAAFLNYNNPKGNEEVIGKMVANGYMVRTRSDADTEEARNGDTTRLEAALQSGAQIISTDYYRPDEREGWSDFQVHLTNRELALVNPVNGGGLTCKITE